MYCGAVGVFSYDLRLEKPTKELLDELGDNNEFIKTYMKFIWARQYVMLKDNLMRRGDDSDT